MYIQDIPKQDGLARYWKTSSEARAGQKLEKNNGKKEETGDFLSINPHKTETMPEKKMNKN